MALKLVKVKVDLHALVKRVNSSDGTFAERPPREDHGKQNVQKHTCHLELDENEWNWRWEKAIDLICGGDVETTGTYYGDVIGGEWLIP